MKRNFQIDLNTPRHRRNVLIASLLLLLAGAATILTGFQVYEYTESAEFCGTICHPMVSEFARYEESPHANVECAHCHIGPGASFFIKAKIDGIKQVAAVLSDSYERPIKSPVHNLRPARETCQECHSPTQFRDNVIKTITHYANNEQNTPVQSTLILKMGGFQESTGISQGIHWHITNPVYYIASDEQRQAIIWVGVEQPDGSLKEYFTRDMLAMAQTSFVEDARSSGEVREMDCIDCHNRAAHLIPPPEKVVDSAISHGKLPANLPYFRSKAVELLRPTYLRSADAYAAIDALVDYYRTEYPVTYIQRRTEIETALEELKAIYTETNFPDMGLNWQTNPNNAVHTPSLGCFRCHDDKHVSVDESGSELETISVKCNLCHTVPIVGQGEKLLVEAPVITGAIPDSHSDFRWTVSHRTTTPEQSTDCFQCHGQAFCNNGACHNLSHPPDMIFTHAEEYRARGDETCYTCHQNVLCSRCHPGGIVNNP